MEINKLLLNLHRNEIQNSFKSFKENRPAQHAGDPKRHEQRETAISKKVRRHLPSRPLPLVSYAFYKQLLSCFGGGSGNPLQYSCLENPMDRGAWRGAGNRVAKSLR